MLKYLIDAIYCHAVIGLMHIVEGVLFMHNVSMPLLATVEVTISPSKVS